MSALDNILNVKTSRSVEQREVFRFPKGRLSHRERRPFARRKAVFGKASAYRHGRACAHAAFPRARRHVRKDVFLSIIHIIIVLLYAASAIFFSNFAKTVQRLSETI